MEQTIGDVLYFDKWITHLKYVIVVSKYRICGEHGDSYAITERALKDWSALEAKADVY